MVRYNKKVKELEYCDGTKWSTFLLVGEFGRSALWPASSCTQISLKYKSSSNNGQYWIKLSASDSPFQVKNYTLNLIT